MKTEKKRQIKAIAILAFSTVAVFAGGLLNSEVLVAGGLIPTGTLATLLFLVD